MILETERLCLRKLNQLDWAKTVQGSLGHATAAFTLDAYGQVSDRMKTESAARMQTFLDGLEISKG